MPKPQPYRLPTRFDSATFTKHAIPGEPVVIVKAMGVGSTSPFEFSDRNGRQAIFRFEMKYDGHVLRVPASIWNANKGAMANDLMDQRRLPLPLVVLVEITPACGPQQTQELPKSQVGEAVNSPGSYSGIAGANPAPATTSSETGATVMSDNAPNVVGQGDEPPVAPSSVTLSSSDLEGDGTIPSNQVAPLHSRAWDFLESPMRLKELAAVLETDADTLKAAIQDTLSSVELGHAGWVKRREPQA